MRAMFYIGMVSLRDEETQKNGVVAILFNVGPNRIFFEESSFLMQAVKANRAIPWKVSGIHYVYDDHFLYPYVAFSRFMLPSKIRARFVPHLGTYSHNCMVHRSPVGISSVTG